MDDFQLGTNWSTWKWCHNWKAFSTSNGAAEITRSTDKLAEVCSFLTQITWIRRETASPRGYRRADTLWWSSISRYNIDVILDSSSFRLKTKPCLLSLAKSLQVIKLLVTRQVFIIQECWVSTLLVSLLVQDTFQDFWFLICSTIHGLKAVNYSFIRM